MSRVPNIPPPIAGVSQNELKHVNPAVLEILLSAHTATQVAKVAKELVAPPLPPPPQVIVRWNNHAIAFSRNSLQTNSMLMIYCVFTQAFDLINKAVGSSIRNDYDPNIRKRFTYVPMKFYVTFLRGSGVDANKEHEASDWEDSWRGIVPNIDEIHIVTLPEYDARRTREDLGVGA